MSVGGFNYNNLWDSLPWYFKYNLCEVLFPAAVGFLLKN
jgi:hypothetical protein